MKNPWKKVSSKVVYKNPWIQITEDKVVRPDGKPGIYTFMVILPGIAVLPIDEKGFIYLIEEYHYPTKTTLLKPVSGGIDAKETALHAAKRELIEELGIEAKKWVSLGSTNAFASTVDGEANMFLAQGLRFVESNQEGTEVIKSVKIKLEKAVRMVLTGKISNGNTCILLLKAYYKLRGKTF